MAKSSDILSELQKLVLESHQYFNAKYKTFSSSPRSLSAILQQARSLSGKVEINQNNISFVAGIAGGIDSAAQAEVSQLLMTAMSLIGIPLASGDPANQQDKGSGIYFSDLLSIARNLEESAPALKKDQKKILIEFREFYDSVSSSIPASCFSESNGLNNYIVDLPFEDKIKLCSKFINFFNGRMNSCLKISASTIKEKYPGLDAFLRTVGPNLASNLKAAQDNLTLGNHISKELLDKIGKVYRDQYKVEQKAARIIDQTPKLSKRQKKLLKLPKPLSPSSASSGFPDIETSVTLSSSATPLSVGSEVQDFRETPPSLNYQEEIPLVPITFNMPCDDPRALEAYGFVRSQVGLVQLIGYPQPPVVGFDHRNCALWPVNINLPYDHPDVQFFYGLNPERQVTTAAPSSSPNAVSTHNLSEQKEFVNITEIFATTDDNQSVKIGIDQNIGFYAMAEDGIKRQILHVTPENILQIYVGNKPELLENGGTSANAEDDKDFVKISSITVIINDRGFAVTVFDSSLHLVGENGNLHSIGPDTDDGWKLGAMLPTQRQQFLV